MLRGLVHFSKAQIVELVYVLEKEKFKGLPVYLKVNSALNQKMEEVPVELSEDEVELLLDEIDPTTNPAIRKLLSEAILRWRK